MAENVKQVWGIHMKGFKNTANLHQILSHTHVVKEIRQNQCTNYKYLQWNLTSNMKGCWHPEKTFMLQCITTDVSNDDIGLKRKTCWWFMLLLHSIFEILTDNTES